MFLYSHKIKNKSFCCKFLSYSYLILLILIYMYILSIINTILKYDLYTHFINNSFNINTKKLKDISYNEIYGFSDENYTCKLILINDFLNSISEIKILLSCFDIVHLNLKYIPVYKQGLYYGVSNISKGSILIPSSSGLVTDQSIFFKIISNNYSTPNKDNKLDFGFSDIKYSNNISYSSKSKTIYIKNIQGIETYKIQLSCLNRNNAIDIIQRTLFIILNCIINPD